MVRLKAQTAAHLTSVYGISIPYGSIKRRTRTECMCGWCTISIPYGSIKRMQTHTVEVELSNFNSLWFD